MAQTETLNILNLRCERFNPRLGQYDVSSLIPTAFHDEVAIHQFKGTTGSPYSVPLPPKQTSKVLWIRNDSNQQLTLTQSTSNIVVDVDQGVMIFGGTDFWKVLSRGSGSSTSASFFSQIAGDTILLDAPNTGIQSGNIKLNGEVTDQSIDLGVLPPDEFSVALPTNQQQYSSSIERGIIRNTQQANLDPTSSGFPNGAINSFIGDTQLFSTTGSQTSICRSTNTVLSPTDIRTPTFGNTFSFQDRAVFDPLQIRGDKVGTSFLGVEIPPEYEGCFATVNIHVEGDWAGLNAPNSIRVYVEQFRGGVLLRTLNLGIDTRNVGENRQVCISPIRHLVGQSTYGEDILSRDIFRFHVENTPTSTDDFNLLLIQGGITIKRGS
tara:strand:- start:3131 stop:4270 length:1140 start_codon:yes stop_codon:yes gene_type:complete